MLRQGSDVGRAWRAKDSRLQRYWLGALVPIGVCLWHSGTGDHLLNPLAGFVCAASPLVVCRGDTLGNGKRIVEESWWEQ